MRVLHVFKTYWPDTFGGMERVIHAIARGTSALGITSEVLSLSRAPQENTVFFDGHWALKARLDLDIASTGLSLDAFRLFAKRARAADLIHYHFPWPFMDLLHFAVRHGKPGIVTYQSDIVKQQTLLRLYRPLKKRFLRSVDHIVVASPNYLETSETLAPFRGKTRVIANGLSEADYPAPHESRLADWRARFPQPFFLFTGVLRYYKGLHVLLAAARNVEAQVLIVGGGAVEAALRRQAAELGLANVHFLGPLDEADKIALLQLCTGFVFPSHLRAEAYGMSLVEAAMAGKPMISAEIGTGTSYVNQHGETGLVVAPEDPDALAAAMNRLLADPAMAAAFGNAARRRYQDLFTADQMARAYAALYRETLKGA